LQAAELSAVVNIFQLEDSAPQRGRVPALGYRA